MDNQLTQQIYRAAGLFLSFCVGLGITLFLHKVTKAIDDVESLKAASKQ